jgi:hypothetical protein
VTTASHVTHVLAGRS